MESVLPRLNCELRRVIHSGCPGENGSSNSSEPERTLWITRCPNEYASEYPFQLVRHL